MNPVLLRSLDDVGRIGQRLRDAWESCGGVPLEISLKRYKPKRSLPQNSRLFWLHTLTANHLNETLRDAFAENQHPAILAAMRQPWDAELVHKKIYKPQFLKGKSSTRRDRMQTVDDQTEYEVWMTEIGVVFPEPNQDNW